MTAKEWCYPAETCYASPSRYGSGYTQDSVEADTFNIIR